MLLDGKVAAASLKDSLKLAIEQANKNRPPKLAILVSNHDDGSVAYLKGRQKLAASINVEIEVFDCQNYSETEIISLLDQLSADTNIDGIMVDRPLNKGINEDAIFAHLATSKDVDGCTLLSSGLLFQAQSGHVSATSRAVMELLKFYQIDLKGKNVAVLGRSKNVGKPLGLLLLNQDATVTLCHSKSKDLAKICQAQDIVIVAIGKKEFIDESYFNPNSIVVDVGIHYDENGKMVGDVKQSVYTYVKAISPVPGGVGPLTNIALMQNLIDSYKRC
jgi:methylenetetrahydrofolate dehydrogenase (NADP+)/methenyltetrahydrofolate cyclohydrolase